METVEINSFVGNMATDSKKNAPTSGEFESNLGKLEQLINQLEEATTPLSKSLGLFEQGITLSRHAQKSLSLAEQKIRVLMEDADGQIDEHLTAPNNDQ